MKGVLEAIWIARAAGIPLRIAAKVQEAGERAYFETEVRQRLGEGVDFVGELNATEKYAFLGNAVALLNPVQWEEPFGLVMIEALATGTPVLATPRGAAPELVVHGRTGFLAPTKELVGLLQRAAGLDRRDCRKDAVARFDATRMVANHLALYAKLVRCGATAA